MLDIKFIRENPDLVKKNCADRGARIDIERLLELDEKRRQYLRQAEDLRAMRNKGSRTKPSPEEITKLKVAGDDIARLEKDLELVEAEFQKIMAVVPNITHPDSPRGGEDAFKILMIKGKPPKFNFEAKDHEQLLTELGLLDFERGAKVTGNKFYFTKGALVRLNHALISYGIEIITKKGYTLMETPDLARNEILQGIGFNPRGPESQVYSVENSDLSLIGTAEITIGGYHANEVLDLSRGPKKYVAVSHCFRTEAGAYGRASKGLYRVHQFTKLEMFIFCRPEDGEKMHQEILDIEKTIVDGLKLPYRVVDIASGDLGGPAYRKFDIEAWMVMQNGYGEITSTSNCTDYQARRLSIRYRNKGETDFVHTLNGTAIVTSRLPIAIAENYQTKKGTIMVLKVLQKYVGLKEIS